MPTALELTRKGWQSYIEAAIRRPPPPELTSTQIREREEVLKRVRLAALMLKRRYFVKRVVLFGSLAHESWFVSGSDVDLAVEGIETKDYWQAWRDVEEIIQGKSVDFVEMETVGDSLRMSIEKHGLEI
jgi:predicted nucleotidyltransferase